MTLRWRTAAALALLFACTAGVYWRITISGQYTWLESPDSAFQVRPWLDFQARELHAGRLPFWDPYLWGGQSLIGQVQPGLANPVNWILFAMPLRGGHIPASTLQWYWVSIHWLAAALGYWLCRDLKAGRAASVLGGCIFALSGFMGHTDWPQFLMSALPLPLVFLFLARVYRGERQRASAALCGAALGAAFLSGHHNIPIYTAVLVGALWAWFVLRNWRRRAAWASAAVFLILALLVSAFQVLPAVEYGRRSVRWAGTPEPQRWNDKLPYQVHAEFSLPPRSVAGLAVPGLWKGLHANPYVGAVAVLLALAAVALRRRTLEVKLFGAVAVGGLLLALGSHTPVHRLAYELIPMVDKARYPVMAVVLCQLGVAVLAALGLDAIPGRRWRVAVAPAALALFLAEAVLAAPSLARLDRPGAYAKLPGQQADVAEFLKRQPGWFRVEVDEDDVPYNFGDWFGIEQFGGYTASLPASTFRRLGSDRTPRLFGIRYRVARKPSSPAQVPVFESRSGLKVWLDPRVADPLWTVRPQLCAAPDRLRPARRLPDAFTITAEMACPGVVVSGDAWYPGWRAWVDGKRVPVQEAEGVIRGVRVDAGSHVIEYRYRPLSVYLGAAMSGLGLLAAALMQRRKQS